MNFTYYQKHKEEINKKRSQIIGCKLCNCAFRYDIKTLHLKSKKHQKNLGIEIERKKQEYTLNPNLECNEIKIENETYLFYT